MLCVGEPSIANDWRSSQTAPTSHPPLVCLSHASAESPTLAGPYRLLHCSLHDRGGAYERVHFPASRVSLALEQTPSPRRTPGCVLGRTGTPHDTGRGEL